MKDALLMYILFPLAGYFFGSIPFGPIIGRLHKIDLRKEGSGNVGATNVGRILGRRWGYICFLLDVAKGFFPVFLVGFYIAPDPSKITVAQQLGWILIAMGCIMGHVFNIWLKFQGGKGVATSLGVILGLFPFFTWAGLTAFGLWVIVTVSTRYVSVGSIAAAASFVPLMLFYNWKIYNLGPSEMLPFVIFSLLICFLIIYLHKGNIKRLVARNENKINIPFLKRS